MALPVEEEEERFTLPSPEPSSDEEEEEEEEEVPAVDMTQGTEAAVDTLMLFAAGGQGPQPEQRQPDQSLMPSSAPVYQGQEPPTATRAHPPPSVPVVVEPVRPQPPTGASNVGADYNAMTLALARQIQDGNYHGTDLSAEELRSARAESSRSKKSMQQKASAVDRFFNTIRDHGGPQMSYLLEDVTSPDGLSTHKRFYDIVGGQKHEVKYQILNICLVLCARRWRKEDGGSYQPSSFSQLTKQLFSNFKSHGILYQRDKDFNDQGGFASVVQADWKKERETNKDFGTGAKKAGFDEAADAKIANAVNEKRFLPLENFWHMIAALVYVLGRFVGLRGRKEITYLTWHEVSIAVYDSGPDKGKKYLLVKLGEDKVRKMTLANPKVDPALANGIPVREFPNWPICPVKLVETYRTWCPPEQERFFCHLATGKLLRTYEVNGHSYKSNPKKPIGVNNIGEQTKFVAQLCGFENWEKCTNHGNRALLITTLANSAMSPTDIAKRARHTSLHSQESYIRESKAGSHNMQNALAPAGSINVPSDESRAKQVPQGQLSSVSKDDQVQSANQPSNNESRGGDQAHTGKQNNGSQSEQPQPAAAFPDAVDNLDPSEREQLEQERKNVEEQLSEANTKLIGMSVRYEQVLAEKESLEGRHDELLERLGRMRNQDSYDSVVDRVRRRDRTIDRIDDEINNLRRDVDELEESLKAARDEVEEREGRLNSLAQDHETLQNAHATQGRELRSQLSEKEQELVTTRSKLQSVQSQLAETQLELRTARNNHQSEQTIHATQVRELEGQLSQKTNENKRLSDELDGYKRREELDLMLEKHDEKRRRMEENKNSSCILM